MSGLQATEGRQVEVESVDGPSSYPTGGFSARSNLGRVDESTVEAVGEAYEASSTVDDDNAVVIEAYSQGGGEVPAGDDISGTTFTYQAYRL